MKFFDSKTNLIGTSSTVYKKILQQHKKKNIKINNREKKICFLNKNIMLIQLGRSFAGVLFEGCGF